MGKTFFLISFLFLNILLVQTLNAQSKSSKTKFSQNDIEKNKIFYETFHLYKYKNKKFSSTKDTLFPILFVDDRNYKGIINYGVQFRSKNFDNFQYLEGLHMHFLKVEFEKAIFNPKDSIVEIEGYVSGGWGDLAKKELKEIGLENKIDIFLGDKIDTIYNYQFGKIVNQEFIDVKLNGADVNETTILDTFPAFYFKNYSHYRTSSQKGKRYFKIKGKVKNNTLLVFGGHYCYSEVFDLSSMVFDPKKNKQKKIIKREGLSYVTLIQNNELLSEVGKEKTKELNYYTYTDEAENYILKRLYVKAKEQYVALDKKYPVLFARDIHNAIRCAVLSRDYENAYFWAEKLAKKGVPFKYFDSKIFNLLKKNKEWNNFNIKYNSIYNEFQARRDIKFKIEIEKLLQEDQADYGLTDRKEPKVLFDTTERVTNKLIDLLNDKGYPSEEKIGVYTKNDTVIIPFPNYNVLIRHAIQQKPKRLEVLNDLLTKSIKKYEYDSKRSPNNVFNYNSCFHIYKGNLYNSKSCGSNDLMVRKMKFIFNNSNGFFIHTDNYVITEYNKENPEEYDKIYKEQFNFVMKIADNWGFYEN